jgi:KipI family sensor histidine kinase inhibitor
MQFEYASDQCVLVRLGDEISLDTHQRVRRLLYLLESWPVDHVRNLHPAYCSLVVKFDAFRTDHETVERELCARIEHMDGVVLPPPRLIEIPVHYDGPDLAEVAGLHGLTSSQVIELHSGATYTVYFLGFAPGFAYLAGLPDQLATPRLPSPRKRVEAGSVAIAGNQSAVYPFSTPGGWRLIGRTSTAMFTTSSLLQLGDQVRFRPVS